MGRRTTRPSFGRIERAADEAMEEVLREDRRRRALAKQGVVLDRKTA